MRRVLITGALACALVAGGAGSAWSAPTKASGSEPITVVCAGNEVHMLLSPGGGNKSWEIQIDGTTTGTEYHLKWISGRFYAGDLDTEPAGDPLFGFEKSFGRRAGQGDAVACSTKFTETFEGDTFTAFFDGLFTSKG